MPSNQIPRQPDLHPTWHPTRRRPSAGLVAGGALLLAASVPLAGCAQIDPGWAEGPSMRAAPMPGQRAGSALPSSARVGQLAQSWGRLVLRDRESGQWRSTEPDGWRDGPERTPNWPLTEGDALRTEGAGSRAVLRFGDATLRLGADTELKIATLRPGAVVIDLLRGVVALQAWDGPANRLIEVRTRDGAFRPREAGRALQARIEVEPDATEATAWMGTLQFEGRDTALAVAPGQRADFWRDGASRYQWAAPRQDAFRRWAEGDGQQELQTAARGVLPPGVPGAVELDRHGDWIDDSEHGSLWVPRQLPPGWAPYTDGRWVWMAPYGWTWIDAAPWGFAPFHWGVWVQWGSRWAWSPGRRGDWHGQRGYRPWQDGWVSRPPALHDPRDPRDPRHRPPPPVVVRPPDSRHDRWVAPFEGPDQRRQIGPRATGPVRPLPPPAGPSQVLVAPAPLPAQTLPPRLPSAAAEGQERHERPRIGTAPPEAGTPFIGPQGGRPAVEGRPTAPRVERGVIAPPAPPAPVVQAPPAPAVVAPPPPRPVVVDRAPPTRGDGEPRRPNDRNRELAR